MIRRLLRSRLRRVALAMLAVPTLATGTTGPAGAAIAASRQTAAPTITLTRSSWIVGTGTWSAELAVTGIPLDATVVTEVRRALPTDEQRLRSALETFDATVSRSAVLNSHRETFAESLVPNAGATVGTTLTVRDLPRAGVYPIVVRVVDRQGGPIVSTTLLAVRTPSSEVEGPLHVAFYAAGSSGPVLGSDSTVSMTDEARVRLRRWQALARADSSDSVSFGIDPEEIVGLRSSDLPADTTLLDGLRSSLASHPVIRATWVPVALEGWTTTATPGDIQPFFVDGQQEIADQLGHPVEARVWLPDPSAGRASVGLLRSVGIDRILIDPDRMDRRTAPSADPGLTRSFQLTAPDAADTQAMLVDRDLSRLLARAAVDPQLAANQALGALAAMWLTDTDHRRGVVIDVSETEPAVIAAVTAAVRDLTTDSPLDLVTVADVFERVDAYPSGRDRLRRPAPEAAAPDVRTLAASIRHARSLANSHREFAAGPDPDVELIDHLISTAGHRDLEPAAAEAYTARAVTMIKADFDAVTTPSDSTITVTSRDAVLPLRIDNGLDHDVNVIMRLRSPRLEFPNGARQPLELKPGVNRVDVDVGVRTSGEFGLIMEIASPDDALVLSRSELKVRSKAFSGVGVVLSVGAIVVLIAWWIRTHRKNSSKPRETLESAAPDQAPAEAT